MKIERVILTTENCRYCLMCTHVCPVGYVTRKETLTPHGWGLTIASVDRGLLDWNEDTVNVLYSCADCGTCRTNCVTDQPLPEVIAAKRAEVAAKNLAPPEVYELHASLEEWGNPYEEQHPEEVEGDGEIALFVGDDAYYLWPTALEAALNLLRAVGVEPILIGVGRNNGYLASSLGFPEMAKKLARSNLMELEGSGAKQLLVLTPGDFYTFDQLYEERLEIEWPKHIDLVEVVTYLAEKLDDGSLELGSSIEKSPYAYLDPTHSVRVKTRYESPRRLLSTVLSAPNIEMFWRRERAHPCGNVALQFTNPHIATHLNYSRIDDAQRAGAKLLFTEDPGCLAQLVPLAGRFDLRVQGFYEFLGDHLA